MTVEIQTIYRYKLVHPQKPEYLEFMLYSKDSKDRWEQYILYFQEWLQTQRDKPP